MRNDIKLLYPEKQSDSISSDTCKKFYMVEKSNLRDKTTANLVKEIDNFMVDTEEYNGMFINNCVPFHNRF